MLAEALEFGMGADAALLHLRAMNAVQVERACALGWAYRDAEAASETAAAELKDARGAGFGGLLDRRHETARRSRALWMASALGARAATDAARGAKEALDCHESGEPWRRRTGNENGLFLIERGAGGPAAPGRAGLTGRSAGGPPPHRPASGRRRQRP